VGHYCVTNIPSAVAQTSNVVLNNATLPYTLKLLDQRWEKAFSRDLKFLKVLNIHKKITCEAVAETICMDYTQRGYVV
jgi:alanine dehydrogenase